jgi:hypothetical protein
MLVERIPEIVTHRVNTIQQLYYFVNILWVSFGIQFRGHGYSIRKQDKLLMIYTRQKNFLF